MLTTPRLLLATAAVAAIVTPVALGEESPTPAPTTTTTAPPTLAFTERIYPKRTRVIHTRIIPSARPSPQAVLKIINIEAARSGASAGHLASRIHCESGFGWAAQNGQYAGLGQFAEETFRRGMASIGSRVVKWVAKRYRQKRVVLRDNYSDGTFSVRMGWTVRQRVVHRYRGVIPRNPPRTHGWAQVRIMARAMVGQGNVHDSEWACR